VRDHDAENGTTVFALLCRTVGQRGRSGGYCARVCRGRTRLGGPPRATKFENYTVLDNFRVSKIIRAQPVVGRDRLQIIDESCVNEEIITLSLDEDGLLAVDCLIIMINHPV
jgi:hypothetical protein